MKDVSIIKASINKENNFRGGEKLRVAAYCRVSTDSEEQLSSYKSQVQYYTDLINGKSEWSMAGVYADQGMTGTDFDKREDFKRMMKDALSGKIDMIITKSVSRFGRNTMEFIKHVRNLQAHNVAVLFEQENINTMTMQGETLLVIMSCFAQQDVETLSKNVKKGFQAKMSRGELVSSFKCLGYNYDIATKEITINDEEAEIIRSIFNLYLSGFGCRRIAKELEAKGYLTPTGLTNWSEGVIVGIITNEKYVGDLVQGKTFRADPITKRRIHNRGEQDKYYTKDHHVPIIDRETFDRAQELYEKRRYQRAGTVEAGMKREKWSRKYAFSSLIQCGFCSGRLERRVNHGMNRWQCNSYTHRGKASCPYSVAIRESHLEELFVMSYNRLCQYEGNLIDELLHKVNDTLSKDESTKQFNRLEKEIDKIIQKKDNLIDLRLEKGIDKQSYEAKFIELSETLEQLMAERDDLSESVAKTVNIKTRIEQFKKIFDKTKVLEKFDREIFESVIEKVIVGSVDEDGNPAPHTVTFIYKTGFSNDFTDGDYNPRKQGPGSRLKDIKQDLVERVSNSNGTIPFLLGIVLRRRMSRFRLTLFKVRLHFLKIVS